MPIFFDDDPRRILGIDLGSARAGWAYFDGPRLMSAGTWRLERHSREDIGVRMLRLWRNLDAVIEISRLPVDLVAYELVRSHTSSRFDEKAGRRRKMFNVQAAHAYGATRGILLMWAALRKLEKRTVTVQDVKMAATGKGGGPGTKKEHVLTAARERWPAITFPDDNSADAAFVGLAAVAALELTSVCGYCKRPFSGVHVRCLGTPT